MFDLLLKKNQYTAHHAYTVLQSTNYEF